MLAGQSVFSPWPASFVGTFYGLAAASTPGCWSWPRAGRSKLALTTAVVAAESVIRFRELNAQKAWENGTIGIDDVTEYFFVGSFASWIVALAG
jgi:hypothetical protein